MVKILAESIVLCLAFIGFIELIKMLVVMFSSTTTNHYSDIVIPVYANDNDIELLLRSLIPVIEWDEKHKIKQLICIDCGMDAETRSICERICSEYDFVHITTPDEYCENIKPTLT